MPSGVVFNRFIELGEKFALEIAAAVTETAHDIENDVKGGAHAAPIQTGNLRRSYHVERKGPTESIVGGDLGIAPYGIYVEYGTYKMAARPHLRPATNAQKYTFFRRVAAIVQGRSAAFGVE